MDFDPSRLDSINDDVEFYIEVIIIHQIFLSYVLTLINNRLKSSADDDGALGVDDEFDVYEELQLDSWNVDDVENDAVIDSESKTIKTSTEPIDIDIGITFLHYFVQHFLYHCYLIVKIGIPKKTQPPSTPVLPIVGVPKAPVLVRIFYRNTC